MQMSGVKLHLCGTLGWFYNISQHQRVKAQSSDDSHNQILPFTDTEHALTSAERKKHSSNPH